MNSKHRSLGVLSAAPAVLAFLLGGGAVAAPGTASAPEGEPGTGAASGPASSARAETQVLLLFLAALDERVRGAEELAREARAGCARSSAPEAARDAASILGEATEAARAETLRLLAAIEERFRQGSPSSGSLPSQELHVPNVILDAMAQAQTEALGALGKGAEVAHDLGVGNIVSRASASAHEAATVVDQTVGAVEEGAHRMREGLDEKRREAEEQVRKVKGAARKLGRFLDKLGKNENE